MKRIYALLISGLLLATACSDSDTQPDPVTPAEKTVFVANGITDITMSENGTATLVVLVELKNTIQEPVNIAVKDLPANVSCTISPENGTPSFTSMLTFKASNAAKGEYPAKITLTSVSGVVKTYNFKVTITQPSSVMNRLIGNYRLTANPCDTVTRTTVERSPTISTRIIFKKLVMNKDIYGNVDTVAKTISIPSQGVQPGLTAYEGTASFSNNTITLNGLMRHLGGGGSGTPCNTTLTKY